MKTKIFRKKKIYMILVILCLLAFIAYFSYVFGRYFMYNMNEEDKISENFYLEVPYTYNTNNHFCILCKNRDKELNLIVDTKATCMMKDSDVERNGGVYFGELPISSRNSLGQKNKTRLYYFPEFKIDTFSTTPLFKSIDKDYYLYHIIDDGVLGINMLKICTWKFSVDNNKVKLFRNDDTIRLKEESKDFMRIKDGLVDNGIKMNLGDSRILADFTLDLGQSGDIVVNTDVASELKKRYPYKTIRTLRLDNEQDTICLFENMMVEWQGVKIPNCQIGSKPNFYFKQNYIGAKLMHRFNFILSFIYDDNSDKDLYIQPCRNFDKIEDEPIISRFGLNVDKRDDCLKVVNLEEGGIADRKGIRLGDEILQIDSCKFEGEDIRRAFIKYAEDKKEIKILLKDKSVFLSYSQCD